ncbi:MAG TPA: hypothetical protein VF012_05290, partial [Nocardioidaceae bacterium]
RRDGVHREDDVGRQHRAHDEREGRQGPPAVDPAEHPRPVVLTGDPYLVFVTNAFALLGLRALYFVLEGALSKLVHLGYGLAVILGFIGVKLALHWGHLQWPSVPEIPTLASLAVIVVVLAVTTATSLVASRRAAQPEQEREEAPR